VIESVATLELRKALSPFADNESNETHLLTLRRCVLSVVEERKAAGDLPEHIVVFVKRLALEAGVHWSNHAFFHRVIGWTFERYWARTR
jgi:hypothetical protein